MTMPAHLLRILQAKGVITDRGTFRTARLRRCSACRVPVLAGLDGDVLALDVDVDVVPLSRRGELSALVDGRATYELASGGRLHRRRPRQVVHGSPSGASTTHAVHQCDRPVPAAWTIPTPPARLATATKEMPF